MIKPNSYKKGEKIFYESGHGLCWVEFKEKGCPAKKEDYFLTEKELLNIDFIQQALSIAKKEDRRDMIRWAKNEKHGWKSYGALTVLSDLIYELEHKK